MSFSGYSPLHDHISNPGGNDFTYTPGTHHLIKEHIGDGADEGEISLLLTDDFVSCREWNGSFQGCSITMESPSLITEIQPLPSKGSLLAFPTKLSDFSCQKEIGCVFFLSF